MRQKVCGFSQGRKLLKIFYLKDGGKKAQWICFKEEIDLERETNVIFFPPLPLPSFLRQEGAPRMNMGADVLHNSKEKRHPGRKWGQTFQTRVEIPRERKEVEICPVLSFSLYDSGSPSR